jgi:hypothetical protein
MRQLLRNQRLIYYSSYIKDEYVIDENGHTTSEEEAVYSDPQAVKCNVSSSTGEWIVDSYGGHTEYTRHLSFSGTSPLKEGDRVWFGTDTSQPNNYIVKSVSDTLNEVVVTIREVRNDD